MHKSLAFAVLTFALASVPAAGHHSFAMFDQTKTITLSGTVEGFEFINPHSWLHMTVIDESGATATWSFEMGSVGQLARDGWNRDTIAAGEEVAITFHPLEDGSNGGQFRSLAFADGRSLCQGGAGSTACTDNPNF